MRLFVLIAFLFLTCLNSIAQDNFLKWDENKPLQLTDFLGNIKDSSNFDAESFAEVRYSYKFNSLSDFSFDIHANFNRNSSWIKKEYGCDKLLKHEQLHFDIAELFARRLKLVFETFNYSENYEYEILALFNEQKNKYHLMQNKYDQETDHSVNKLKQLEWENFITRELAKLKSILNEYEKIPMLVTNDK